MKWKTGHTILAYQIPLLIAMPFYIIYCKTPSLSLIFVSLILFVVSELGITAGYHRLYSHRSYKTNPVIEAFLVFFASLAGQKSVITWAYEHRLHHAFVDTDKDPYSIKKGFWFAHFMWLFEDHPPVDPKVVSDLLKNPILVFQHKYENTCMFIPNVIVTYLIGWWMNDFTGAVMISLGVRLFLNHHCTFFINSLAHTFGSRPYDKTLSAVNNYFISFPTFGEGFHNFHHAFPTDYRNGVRWFDFDPTKWLIWSLSLFGLAKNLKRTSRDQMKKQSVECHSDVH